jgi:hypothetical protein
MSVFEKVVVGLVVAAIGVNVVLFWNWSSSGGLVRAVGGITRKELVDEVAKHAGPPGDLAQIPKETLNKGGFVAGLAS